MTHWIKQNRGFLIFLLCFGFFRTAVARLGEPHDGGNSQLRTSACI